MGGLHGFLMDLHFNLSDTHISWKGYLIGSLTPKINIHLMAYKKQELPLKKKIYEEAQIVYTSTNSISLI